jgi:hypothetical protein
MNQRDDVSGIADASRPNAGRMYDYFLGGNHNFEIDRQACEQVLNHAPHMPNFLMLIRWFLGEATRRLCKEGFNKFLDFASGLPTMDHIHQVAPEGTKVIYSDIDTITVAYAQEILGDNPDVRFLQCDAGKPEEVLGSGIVEELFGNDRKVAIGVNGVLYFMPDDDVAHSLKVLYDWADEGSKLFLCDGDTSEITEDARKTIEIYEKSGQPMYLRPLDNTLELIKPWTVDEPGVQLLEEWVDMDAKVTASVKETWGSGALNGMILKK